MTSSTLNDPTDESSAGLHRRTLVRAGAHALWVAPVVTLATTAPAMAASPTTVLSFTAASATYQNLGTATVNPHILLVTSTIKATGSATTGLVVTVTVPANVTAVAPTVSAPAGFTASAPIGSLAAGWTIAFTAAAQIPANGTAGFAPQFTLNDPDSTPYRRWAGHATPLNLIATASNATTGVAAPTAAETANTTLQVNGWTAFRTSRTNDLWIGDTDGLGTPSTTVVNTGRKTCGPITLSVVVPDTGGRYSQVSPNPPDSVASGWTFVSRTPTSNTTGPWTYTFQTTASAFGPDDFSAVANATAPPFRARILLAGSSGGTPRTVNITATAAAPYANASPTVSDDAGRA